MVSEKWGERSQPLVSVVMPSMNQCAFIEASIRSVLTQSYSNLELIVADGGSTDGTQALLEVVAAHDRRVVWFSECDSGPAQALNRALSRVRGTLIGWLNSDDLYVPGAVDRAVKAFGEQREWVMVYGEAEHIDVDGKVLNRYPTLPPSASVYRFPDGCFICQPTVFFRRTLNVLLGPLDETLKTAFDFDYWIRAFKVFPDRIGMIDQVQAQSRLHENCITMSQRKKVMLEGMSVLSKHFGVAPVHWGLTYFSEINKQNNSHWKKQAHDFLIEAVPFLESSDIQHLQIYLNKYDLGIVGKRLALRSLILNLRADLRKKFNTLNGFDEGAFLSWLVTSGCIEYAALFNDKNFLSDLHAHAVFMGSSLTQLQIAVLGARPDLLSAFPLPEKKTEFLRWFYTHGIEEHPIWPFLSAEEQEAALRQAPPWGERIQARAKAFAKPVSTPIAGRDFGVNLIGYAFGQLGIGEDARMTGRSLISAGVPISMLNFKPGDDIPQNDHSMADYVRDQGEYAINIFCMTAEELGRFYAEKGQNQFAERYNIGYWPWELPNWPQEWEMLLDLVDEVWVATQHIYDALRPVCAKPLFIMPLAVDLGEVTLFSSATAARAHFDLPEKARLFCFAFDLNSYVDRKNPQACVDAFLKAFPAARYGADEVGLVIKVHKPRQKNAAWESLKALAAEDQRIHIVETTLSRPDLLALYKACDCFVSLHRAEGYGRGLAEAMQLGLHVICTGYSGNVDFCQPPWADLVNYRLIPVEVGQYPYAQGQVWADPDVDHAALLMRQFVESKQRSPSPDHWLQFSTQSLGQIYKQRLLDIFAVIQGRPQ